MQPRPSLRLCLDSFEFYFYKIPPFNSHIFARKAMMIYKQSVQHINYQCVDRANFLKLQFFLMKCKSLQNSASQQNTLGCQRGMIFSRSENENLSRNIYSKASDLSSKVLPEKISNSIAIQTSPSLKGWQNEWRCSSKDAFASSREKCTWRINTRSTMSKSKCVLSTIFPFCVPVDCPAWWIPLSQIFGYLCAQSLHFYNVFRCLSLLNCFASQWLEFFEIVYLDWQHSLLCS